MPTSNQSWPLHLAKYVNGSVTEFYAYFENGAIRQVGSTEYVAYRDALGLTDPTVPTMSAWAWGIAKAVSQNLFGVPAA